MVVELVKDAGMIRLKYRSCEDTENKYRIKIRSIGEFLQIYKSSDNWYRLDILGGNSDDIYAPYTGKLKEAYDKVVNRRRIEYYSKNIDMNRKYRPNIPGHYKLVFRPNAGNIFIASRKNRDITSKYTTLITDEVADKFKQDCKDCGNVKKYMLTLKDKEFYNKWASYVHSEYIKLYLQDVKNNVQKT